MFKKVDIQEQLNRVRLSGRKGGEELVTEARRILRKDLFEEKKILENLRHYNRSFEVLDEEDLDPNLIFTAREIKKVAVKYRLRFLDSKLYKPEIPYAALLKIKELEKKYKKDLRHFRVLGALGSFSDPKDEQERHLFVKTNDDHFYLLHSWGKKLSWIRKIKYLPFRSFETLALTVLLTTLLITMSLPTALITLDSKATYWSGYRAAAFFHLLIFDFGVTVYFTFAFAMNFSSSIWNRAKDFE